MENIKLQQYIAKIMSGASEESPLKTSEIKDILWTEFKEDVSRRTVDRNIASMSEFPIQSKKNEDGEEIYPKKFWIEEDYIPKFNMIFDIEELQILLWALQNLRLTSTDFFHAKTVHTTSKILSSVHSIFKSQLRASMKAFVEFTGIYKKPFTFPKNNLSELLKAIREKKWITAKLKDFTLSDYERDQHRRLALGSITFKNNIPYIVAYDEFDNEYKSIRATRLNQIHITKDKVQKKHIDYISDYEINHKKKAISIECKGILAQLFKESEVSSTQKVIESKSRKTVKVKFNMRISNSFINLLLPHTRDILSISPDSLKQELIQRTKENSKALNSL